NCVTCWARSTRMKRLLISPPRMANPARAPWRLALVIVMQALENLTDRQAADAVRSRLDWKYVLSLELTDPGFDHTVLSEFRSRLVAGSAERVDGGSRPRTTTHREDPCASQDPCAEVHAVRRSDDGLRVKCPFGSGPGVGSCEPAA